MHKEAPVTPKVVLYFPDGHSVQGAGPKDPIAHPHCAIIVLFVASVVSPAGQLLHDPNDPHPEKYLPKGQSAHALLQAQPVPQVTPPGKQY